jgi:predicted RNA-binding protein YlqC (UPF0109 family)
MRQFEDLLRFLVEGLVDDPRGIEISGEERGSRVSLTLRVASEDMGKVIGKGGRTINAIRKVMKAASVKAERRVTVEVLD